MDRALRDLQISPHQDEGLSLMLRSAWAGAPVGALNPELLSAYLRRRSDHVRHPSDDQMIFADRHIMAGHLGSPQD